MLPSGRLILVEVPSRRELASKNVYNVKGAAMHWQGSGDFLCLRTMVYKKTGKKGRKELTQLEIFRMREKDIPVDNLQLNDLAVQLHWEDGPSQSLPIHPKLCRITTDYVYIQVNNSASTKKN